MNRSLFSLGITLFLFSLVIIHSPMANAFSPGDESNLQALQVKAPRNEVLFQTGIISGTHDGSLTPQDEDKLIYLPLILKNFNSAQPWHTLSVNKSASSGTVQAGDVLTYTLQYNVSGNEPAPGLTLADTLPQSVTYQSCTGAACNHANGVVTWSLGDVSPYASGLVTMVVQVDNSVVSGTIITNSATLSDASGLMTADTITTPVQTGGGIITGLDVAIIFDMTGSMQFDTICHGCYEPYEYPTGHAKEGEPIPAWTDLKSGQSLYYGHDYPKPEFLHPVPVDHLPAKNLDASDAELHYAPNLEAVLGAPNNTNNGGLCFGRDGGNPPEAYTSVGGIDTRKFIILEAELYSLNTSILAGPFRQPGRGYWAVQHANWRTIHKMMGHTWDPDSSYEVEATPILPGYGRGSWVSHHPYISWAVDQVIPYGHDYTLAEVRNNPNDVPSLEYDFFTTSDWNGVSGDDTYIWIRSQKGNDFWTDTNANLYWAVYDYNQLYNPAGADGDATQVTPKGSGQIEPISETGGSGGAYYGGADGNRWQWRTLTGSGLNLDDNTRYTLKLWAGSPGYDIDQIVIGNRNKEAEIPKVTSDEYIKDVKNNSGATYASAGPARHNPTSSAKFAPYASPGQAFRQACNRCNPIYGLEVDQVDCEAPFDNGYATVATDNFDLSNPANNPLFSGYQPIRGEKEAVKRLIAKFDPEYHQVGIVGYSTGVPDAARVELRCLRSHSNACFQGANPISYTETLDTVEILPPDGSTNMAAGMLKGLEMLGVNADNLPNFDNSCNLANPATSHCSRGDAAKQVMILITDGVPNQTPPNSTCYALDLYQPNTGNTTEDRARDCVMHYAQMAANNNVTLYTIGLGSGADHDLLQAAANLPGSDGDYFPTLSPAQLDEVFNAILLNYYLSQNWYTITSHFTPSSLPIQAGTLVTYTIQYTADANAHPLDLNLEATLPHSTSYQSCLGGSSCSHTNGVTTWNLGSVAPATAGQVQMVVQVEDEQSPLTTSIRLRVNGLGIIYELDNCAPNCGGAASFPFISVTDEFGDLEEPAGGAFSVSVSEHQANTTYDLWFVSIEDPANHSYKKSFTTDKNGSALVDFTISVSALPSSSVNPTYQIFTRIPGALDPAATCLADGLTNAPCFIVTGRDTLILVRNKNKTVPINPGYASLGDDGQEQAQPDEINPPRWPVNSAVPIYLLGHDPLTNYVMQLDGVEANAGTPGRLEFKGAETSIIPTSQFGSNEDDEPGYYIATGYGSPATVKVTSHNGAVQVGEAIFDLIVADIVTSELPAGIPGHPASDVVQVILRNHAPNQRYLLTIEDGVTPPSVVRANKDGELAFSYKVPFAAFTPCNPDQPGCVPLPVKIFTVDYGRGDVEIDRIIAEKTINLFTPLGPYLNVPGGSIWPAGSPITVQVRKHAPNTEYSLYLQQGSPDAPTFSLLVSSPTFITDSNGEYDISYTLPALASGFYTLRTFASGAPTTAIEAFELAITNGPTVVIEDGNRRPPGSTITIRLQNHSANNIFDIWLDKDGPQATKIGTIVTNNDGNSTLSYTIPATMPTKVAPGYTLRSYLMNTDIIVAGNAILEIQPADLVVTNIEVPAAILNVEIPISITLANNSPVTISNLYFDTDIYLDPPAAPNPLDSSLPPGDYKKWIDTIPPNGTATIQDNIILRGQQSHQIYARVDTSNSVVESDETNNVFLKSIPSSIVLGSECGRVEEGGTELIVIDAINTIANQATAGHTWQTITENNILGEAALAGLQAVPDNGADMGVGLGPQVTYQVNVQSGGTYYVWIAGLAPDINGNDLHIGLNGVGKGVIDGFSAGSASWVKMPSSIPILPGANTINLWMKEDGVKIFKILLTQNVNFIPPPHNIAQSACSIIIPPPIPPLTQHCTNPIRKGDFEGTYTEVNAEWTSADLGTPYSIVGYQSNHGAGFPVNGGRQPLIYQTFNLPSWILTDTTATLNLHKTVDQQSGTTATDMLYFALQRDADNFSLISPHLLATGADTPDLDPLNPQDSDWTIFNQDVFNGLNPLSVLQPNDTVRAYFYSPNPGIDTSFFLDNISLMFCTTQPEPTIEPAKGRISGKTLRAGNPITGAAIWAYAYPAGAGNNPGPVFKTTSIQDGTYRFYNLWPGQYIIYAQVMDGNDTFFDSQIIYVSPGNHVKNVILNLNLN